MDELRRALARRLAAEPDDRAAQEAMLTFDDRESSGAVRRELLRRLATAADRVRVEFLRATVDCLAHIVALRALSPLTPGAEAWALREVGRQLGREADIEKALVAGRLYLNCSGSHRGDGSLGCPRTRHHHHDQLCPFVDKVSDAWLDSMVREVAALVFGDSLVAHHLAEGELVLVPHGECDLCDGSGRTMRDAGPGAGAYDMVDDCPRDHTPRGVYVPAVRECPDCNGQGINPASWSEAVPNPCANPECEHGFIPRRGQLG